MTEMFREMLRTKQALSKEACIEILKTGLRGVLSVSGDDGYPYGMPMNHYYCEADGKIYFHGGKQGHKIDALKRSSKASFCVYDAGNRDEGDWALRFRSVIVFGTVEMIDDPETVCRISDALSRKFTGDDAYIAQEIERFGSKTLLLALTPEHMTGKQVREA
jgi:nitroimidazol reductase NimA-like FMN-containing flavoprotein (pyridoxamine 5'-phosphate oxidase superfamily)